MSESLRKRTVSYQETPRWIADNHFLKTGYRTHGESFWEYLRSLFRPHNETLNIWIHFLGAVFFIVIGFYITTLFVSGETVHPHLDDSKHTAAIASTIQVHHEELARTIREEIGSPTFTDKVLHNIQKIEDSLVEYYHHVVPLVEGKAGNLVQSIRRNSQFLIRKIKDFKLKTLSDSLGPSNLLDAARNFVDDCLHPKKIGSLLHVEPRHLEHYPLYVFLMGAVSCLGFSTLFHWFHPINKTVNKILHKLDYAGISLLNFGSSFAIFYYYFYCEPFYFWVASTFIFVGCFGTFIVGLTDWIDLPEQTTFKGLMYGFLGISNVVPALFILYLIAQASEDNHHLPLGAEFFLLLLMAATYLSGLVFYILRIPERWVPYKFDIWCNSHAIWHMFVFLAALEHFVSLLYLYESRRDIHCFHC